MSLMGGDSTAGGSRRTSVICGDATGSVLVWSPRSGVTTASTMASCVSCVVASRFAALCAARHRARRSHTTAQHGMSRRRSSNSSREGREGGDVAAAGAGFRVAEEENEGDAEGNPEGDTVGDTEMDGVTDVTRPVTTTGEVWLDVMTPRSTSGLYTSLNATTAANVAASESVKLSDDTNAVIEVTAIAADEFVEFVCRSTVKETGTPGRGGALWRRRRADAG